MPDGVQVAALLPVQVAQIVQGQALHDLGLPAPPLDHVRFRGCTQHFLHDLLDGSQQSPSFLPVDAFCPLDQRRGAAQLKVGPAEAQLARLAPPSPPHLIKDDQRPLRIALEEQGPQAPPHGGVYFGLPGYVPQVIAILGEGAQGAQELGAQQHVHLGITAAHRLFGQPKIHGKAQGRALPQPVVHLLRVGLAQDGLDRAQRWRELFDALFQVADHLPVVSLDRPIDTIPLFGRAGLEDMLLQQGIDLVVQKDTARGALDLDQGQLPHLLQVSRCAVDIPIAVGSPQVHHPGQELRCGPLTQPGHRSQRLADGRRALLETGNQLPLHIGPPTHLTASGCPFGIVKGRRQLPAMGQQVHDQSQEDGPPPGEGMDHVTMFLAKGPQASRGAAIAAAALVLGDDF